MQKETLNNITERKPRDFIHKLLKAGVPLSNIHTNDFIHCPKPKVVIHKNICEYKDYERFSDYDLNNCLKWFKK